MNEHQQRIVLASTVEGQRVVTTRTTDLLINCRKHATGTPGDSGAVREQSEAVESSSHTKTHTIRHPKPLRLGGGNTGVR